MFEGPVYHGAAEIVGIERRSRGRRKKSNKIGEEERKRRAWRVQ